MYHALEIRELENCETGLNVRLYASVLMVKWDVILYFGKMSILNAVWIFKKI